MTMVEQEISASSLLQLPLEVFACIMSYVDAREVCFMPRRCVYSQHIGY